MEKKKRNAYSKKAGVKKTPYTGQFERVDFSLSHFCILILKNPQQMALWTFWLQKSTLVTSCQYLCFKANPLTYLLENTESESFIAILEHMHAEYLVMKFFFLFFNNSKKPMFWKNSPDFLVHPSNYFPSITLCYPRVKNNIAESKEMWKNTNLLS